MSSYYKLDANYGEMRVYLRQHNNTHLPLLSGHPVDPTELELPYRYSIEFEDDDIGDPAQVTLASYYPGKFLMRRRLVETLRALGGENLQFFPAQITNPASGRVHTDHVVVNVLGLLACADMSACVALPLAEFFYFTRLAIDLDRCHGEVLFRLAESPIQILIRAELAQALTDARFEGLVLEPVEVTGA